MGLNNENARKVCFDLETAPLAEAGDYLEMPDAPSNYKDPIKIAEYVAAKHAENLERCGLDVDLCRIVAIGMWLEGGEPNVVTTQRQDEAFLVRAFWSLASERHLVGFNCLAFDLPVLMRRSQYLGIPVPNLQIDRFKHPGVTDLLSVLSFNGAIKMRGLSFYAKRFNLGIEDTVTGADIASLIAAGEWGKVQSHCEADVRRTGLLAARVGHFTVSEAVSA